MSHTTFSIRIPTEIAEAVETEAAKDSRSRNQMIIKILKDRYHSHAPPMTTKRQPAQAKANTSRKVNSTN